MSKPKIPGRKPFSKHALKSKGTRAGPF